MVARVKTIVSVVAPSSRLKLSSPSSKNVHREIFRMSTFVKFPPMIHINEQQYAKAGFYYLGVSDSVKCFACDNTMQNLTPQMDPFLLRMHRTTCKFTRKEDSCGNIPIHSALSAIQGEQNAEEVSTQETQNNAVTDDSNLPHISKALDSPPVHSLPITQPMAKIIDPDHERYLEQLNLCCAGDRVKSFTALWSVESGPSPRRMANAGWFYLGNSDRTQCFSCGGVLRNWRRTDNPAVEHLTHFPNCAMAQGHEPKNIPEVFAPPLNASELNAKERIDLRNMFPCEFPSTPQMSQLDNRLATYMSWLYTRATPRMVAEAGFFSLGAHDKVKCYYCNGGLQNWRRNDDPWEEHAKWYPSCEYLLQQRGQKYVYTVLQQHPDMKRPIPQTRTTQVSLGNQRTAAEGQEQDRQPIAVMLEVALKSEIVATVVGMGFERTLVQEVMRIYIEAHEKPYSKAADLLDAVMCQQKRNDQRENFQCGEQSSEVQDQSVPQASSFHSSDFASDPPSQQTLDNEGKVLDQSTGLQRDMSVLITERLCKVCKICLADVSFIPCGHICCCVQCTSTLKVCPTCRDSFVSKTAETKTERFETSAEC